MTRITRRFIDPEVLARISNLQLIAKTVVEGFLGGLHRSPYHGFSLDFAEYREYAQGDDVRRVDWKVFGRSDRFYVKKYEGDTNTQVHLVLDASRSMDFTSHSLTKFDYARYLAASVAYFAVRQRDAIGLMTFDARLLDHVPARSQHGHFPNLLHQLENLRLGEKTNISGALEELARLIRKRSLVVLISDFYQDIDEMSRMLRFFHFRGNDVILFHVLDPLELEMPFDGVSTLEDLETQEQLSYVSEYSRENYLKLLNDHIEGLKKECSNVHIDYVLLNTEKPLDWALHRYLSVRSRRY